MKEIESLQSFAPIALLRKFNALNLLLVDSRTGKPTRKEEKAAEKKAGAKRKKADEEKEEEDNEEEEGQIKAQKLTEEPKNWAEIKAKNGWNPDELDKHNYCPQEWVPTYRRPWN